MLAVGLIVSKKKIFLSITHYKNMRLLIPGAVPVWTTGARLAGFLLETTRRCYILNIEAVVLIVSEVFF